MTTPSSAPTAATGVSFGRLLRAEWTKFRSVRSTVGCVVATIGLTILISALGASGSSTNANDGPRVIDQFHFVHWSLAGDGTILAHVAQQRTGQEWAKAGLMLKDGTRSGSPSVAIMVTPGHGVRLQGNFRTEIQGSDATAPRWLRLTRHGDSVTGYESTDGTRWQRVGTVTVASLPSTVEAGLFVTSPPGEKVTRRGTSTTARAVPTIGEGRFDGVSVGLEPRRAPSSWSDLDVGDTDPGAIKSRVLGMARPGSAKESAGAFTVTGSGDVAGLGIGGFTVGDNDTVADSLVGVQIGLIGVLALGVLFMTSEYKTNLIRTTFAASPRRGRVLAAKAVVLGTSVFVAGLVASVCAFLIGQHILRGNGFDAPAYPRLSLTDGVVLRAVVGTALVLSLLAVFGLGLGSLLRRTAGAITLAIALVVVPQIVGGTLSLDTERWVHRLTPSAGLAIQQTRERFDTAIGPWAGLGVLASYVAVTMVAAIWFVRRRDA
jgi:hypothetical protein